MVELIIALVVVSMIASGVYVFMYLSKEANKHIDELIESLVNNEDKVLLRQLYSNQQPKNFMIAWILNFFGPWASYIYLGNWSLAVLSFITVYGLGLWWVAGWFILPFQCVNSNKRKADKAYTELRLARPDALRRNGGPTTVVNVLSPSAPPPGYALQSSPAQPGWHTDPDNPDQLRYFDGTNWTDNVASQ